VGYPLRLGGDSRFSGEEKNIMKTNSKTQK
jgi:hypothetical protein